MAEARFIKRRQAAEQTHSFAGLRRAGIELAQQFSGEQWTDFNLHDPGVTILEQLAFALTDLIYRADFPTADLLSGEQGIDYPRLALYAPEQILPCRPTTPEDYRKALLDTFSELDNCRLQPLAHAEGNTAGYPGLYLILLECAQDLPETQQAALAEQVRGWYLRHRNLCEDLDGIVFLSKLDYALCAHIEVSSAQQPVDVLAEIYFRCARAMACSVTLQDYQAVRQAGASLEELFTGPFTRHGLLQDEARDAAQGEFLLSNLYAAIDDIAGVDHVSDLYLERDGQAFFDTLSYDRQETTLQLRIPREAAELKVVLTFNGRIMPVALEELRVRIEELNFRYFSSRATSQDLSLVYRLPEGKSRPLDQYASIQSQFPANYGIGRYGVPASAPPRVKGRAKQLQGYLLLFEQLMANYQANLAAIPELFSLDPQRRRSYAFKLLSEQQIPGLAALYPDDPAACLADILADFDDYHDRKSRLLDYLLALYGESFAQYSLRHFNYYYHPQEVPERIIDNKLAYLQAVVELGRDRAAAGDYAGASWSEGATSGLQRRVALLLGFHQAEASSLVKGVLQTGLKLARHRTYAHLKAGTEELRFIELKPASRTQELLPVPRWEEAEGLSPAELREYIGEAIPLNNKLLSDLLLHQGIQLERYRLLPETVRGECRLGFNTGEGRYWDLGGYPDQASGMRAANALRRLLIHLNMVSEGFHLLEHILLRPLAGPGHVGLSPPPEEGFYAHRISVIFPAWTARCHDPQFRLLAEETLRLNAPAHIYLHCDWLEFHEMYEFEGLYEKWLRLKGTAGSDPAALDRAAGSLIGYLMRMRQQREADNR